MRMRRLPILACVFFAMVLPCCLQPTVCGGRRGTTRLGKKAKPCHQGNERQGRDSHDGGPPLSVIHIRGSGRLSDTLLPIPDENVRRPMPRMPITRVL